VDILADSLFGMLGDFEPLEACLMLGVKVLLPVIRIHVFFYEAEIRILHSSHAGNVRTNLYWTPF